MIQMLSTYCESFFGSLRKDEDGQGLVEYALIVALISVVAIAALEALGTGALGKLNEAAAEL